MNSKIAEYLEQQIINSVGETRPYIDPDDIAVMADEIVKLFAMPVVSNKTLIEYIGNDAEIAMPIDALFNEDGTNITKKQYGKVLLKYLVIELIEKFNIKK